MKNLKKVLAFVVVFAMMFTFAASANTFPDVPETASYAEAVNILSSLGLMIGDENGNFNPDKILTRAEAATLVVRFKGLESAAEGAKGATQFPDVADSHWASGYINIATQTGIIVGFPDGTFKPEEQVTYDQIVKMIVAALGYTPLANAQGGYPTGYLVVASRKGITKGATGSAGEPAPRSTVARLLYNALEVPTMEQTVFAEGREEFEESDKSVLTDALEFEKYEGTVIAVNPKASGDEDEKTTVDIDTVKKLSAKLEGEDYDGETLRKLDVGETNAADLLGYYVTVYVGEDEDTGKDKIFAIAPKTNRNDKITIDYSQLDKSTDLDNNVVYYLEKATDKSAKKINLSNDVKYYYNGGEDDIKSDKSEAADFLLQLEGNEIHPGTVTFVDSLDETEDQSGYDYVFVTEYTADYVVDEIDADTETITDVDGNTVDIDLDDEKTVYSFEKDGQPAQYEDIAEGDVLTFAEGYDSDNGLDLVKVFISSQTVEGNVTEKRTDDDEVYFTIGGKEYRAGVDYDANEVKDDITKVGNEGTFYINVDGRIVYEDASATAGDNYAFLFKAGTKEGTVSDGTVQIKYLTQEGTWETKDLASSITIYDGGNSVNGIKPAKLEGDEKIAAMAKLFELDGTKVDGAKQQLVQIKTKSDGTVNKIYIAKDGQDKNNFSKDYDTKDYYNASKGKIGRLYLKDDIIVFNVKAADETVAVDDEEDVKVSTAKATFKDDNEYTIVAFDEDNAGYPSVIVAYDAKSDITEDTPILVIDRVTKSTNADGQDILKFYGYQNGEAVSAEGSEDLGDAFEDLAAGDVIIFALDSEGNIDDIKVLFTTEAALAYINDGTAPAFAGGDDVEEDFGQVVKKNTGSRVVLDNGNDYPLTGKDIYYYTVNLNRSKTAVATATYGDVTANTKAGKLGSYTYIRYYDGTAVGCVAYQIDNPEVEEEGEEL